jgi:hypothetical protein
VPNFEYASESTLPDIVYLNRDDVNGSFWSLTGDGIFQKGDELCTGAAGTGLADYLAAPDIESCIEREPSMAIIFKTVSFSPTGRQRQHWVQTIQHLIRFFRSANYRYLRLPTQESGFPWFQRISLTYPSLLPLLLWALVRQSIRVEI